MKLSITNDVAYLSVKNFEMPWDKYSEWLRSAFLRIHNAKVRAVILDLRENNGGDTRQSDALQSYLSVKGARISVWPS
jgi:C-terminal processing protease CtpA/Prc